MATSEIKEPDTTSSRNNRPKDNDDVTFNFFYDLVKKLILKRSDVRDVCTLSSWLKALEQNNDSNIRNQYIKLMVLALQHEEPMCPFKDPPPETIDPLENEVREEARKFMKGEGTATCVGQNEEANIGSYVYPSISTAVSQNKCRYAACQVIPDVGVQCYYAYSDDHLYNWSFPPQISVPTEGPHARDIDWERAIAGIHFEPKPTPKPTEESLDVHKSTSKDKEKIKSKENEESCLHNVEQQDRNVTQEFAWNDASVLTGAIILGAEMCSDRKVDAQVKTQIEIDEEVTSCHDKLYPGDFRILMHPAVIDGIVIPEKKYTAMEAGDKNTSSKPQIDEKHTKKLTDHGQPVRQVAGQESISLTANRRGNSSSGGGVKKKDSKKHRVSKLSTDLAVLKMASNSKSHKSRKSAARGPAPDDGGGEDDDDDDDDDDPEQPNDASSLFDKASMDVTRRFNAVNELFVDECKVFSPNKS